MGVFHVFLIVKMVPNCAKHDKWLSMVTNGTAKLIFQEEIFVVCTR